MSDLPTYTAPQDKAITLDRYDPTSPYHPHDVQILKFFPDEDLPSLSGSQHKGLYHLAVEFEQMDSPPPAVPWPSPPPRPRDELEAGVEDWRKSALEAIDARVALFDHRQRTSNRCLQIAPLTKSGCTGLPHSALLIPELLEYILRLATPSAQCAAWYVSRSWRLTTEYIWMQQYHNPQPCEAIEFGQSYDPSLHWLPAAKEDIIELEQSAPLLLQQSVTSEGWGKPAPFIPARLTQDPSVPVHTYATLQAWYDRRFHGAHNGVVLLPSRADGPRWLDFSQFCFNPYFLDLLHGRVVFKHGRCEINFQPGSRNVFACPLPANVFESTIGSMYLTQPPCKTLGLYLTYQDGEHLHLLERVHSVDGIRVQEFLTALQHHSAEAYRTWRNRAAKLKQAIAQPHWTSFSYGYWRRKFWTVPGCPRFAIFLEDVDGAEHTMTKSAFCWCEYLRDVCQKEWYEDIATA